MKLHFAPPPRLCDAEDEVAVRREPYGAPPPGHGGVSKAERVESIVRHRIALRGGGGNHSQLDSLPAAGFNFAEDWIPSRYPCPHLSGAFRKGARLGFPRGAGCR